MAAWWGDFDDPFTVDNRSLLQAIKMEEGEVTVSNIVKKHITETKAFEVVKTNSHLRNLLKEYLQADASYLVAFRASREHGRIWRMFNKSEQKSLEARVANLKAVRDEAFKKYEMLRKLSDPDNWLLKRIPS